MARRGNGEGTIYYNGILKRWCGQIAIGYQDNGKIKRITVYGKTRKDVKDKLLDAQINPKTIKNSTTISELAKEIVEDKFNMNIINENSYKRALYTYGYIKESYLGDIEIQKVTIKDINNFLSSITRYSNSVIDKIYQLLNRVFKRAIDRDLITKNIMLSEEIVKPKSDKQDRKVMALSIEEELNLISALNKDNSKYKNLLLLMLFTGIRIGEALAIEWNDVDSNCIHIRKSLSRDKNDKVIMGDKTKTKTSSRDIKINTRVRQILDNIPKEYDLLFQDEKGLISPSQVNSYVIRLNNKYKISNELHTHMLRHTYATRCIESGMNIKVLQKNLGHAKIETTLDTYASVLSKFQEDENEKLENYLNSIGLQ